MEVYRIKLSSWTASFRYPNLISGFQPTLDVPPVSTVLGLINAAAGKYLEHSVLSLGYYFKYGAKATDLETIYQFELKTSKSGSYTSNSTKSNVINREFLFDCRLYIYLQNKEIVKYFRSPHYPLFLGRSGDLVSVDEICEKTDIVENNLPSNIRGQIIPFNDNFLPGEIQALPKYFTNTIPRRNIGTEPYSVISHLSRSVGNNNFNTYTDIIEGESVDIYFHKLDFSDI